MAVAPGLTVEEIEKIEANADLRILLQLYEGEGGKGWSLYHRFYKSWRREPALESSKYRVKRAPGRETMINDNLIRKWYLLVRKDMQEPVKLEKLLFDLRDKQWNHDYAVVRLLVCQYDYEHKEEEGGVPLEEAERKLKAAKLAEHEAHVAIKYVRSIAAVQGHEESIRALGLGTAFIVGKALAKGAYQTVQGIAHVGFVALEGAALCFKSAARFLDTDSEIIAARVAHEASEKPGIKNETKTLLREASLALQGAYNHRIRQNNTNANMMGGAPQPTTTAPQPGRVSRPRQTNAPIVKFLMSQGLSWETVRRDHPELHGMFKGDERKPSSLGGAYTKKSNRGAYTKKSNRGSKKYTRKN
jgi:hypothetical protein